MGFQTLNTTWTLREALKKTDATDGLFRRFDEALRSQGVLAMSGQIVDATIVATPKQRNTIEEKKAIKEGQIPPDWKDKPARKPAQKDRDARWTVKYSKAKPREDGSVPKVDLAIPAFGYKNHVSIDRLRPDPATGRRRTPPRTTGRGSKTFWTGQTRRATFWADTAYRSAKNEEQCSRGAGWCRAIHRKKPPGPADA